MNKLFLFLAFLVGSVVAFIPIRSISQTARFSQALYAGSPLPGFDDVVTPASPASDSPLVDRALDSALDFLQDGDAGEEEEDEFEMFDIFEDSPELEIPYDLIAELQAKDSAALASKVPAASVLNKVVINDAVAKWRKHENDCGSAEVQVAIANEKIKYLTKHLLQNKKDVAARRGLNTMVTTRRKFLNYLYENDRPKAVAMITEMGIRYRPPGRLWDKEAKYAAYKNTKSPEAKLKTAQSVKF